MTTVHNRDTCLYRSEAFAEDLQEDEDMALGARQRKHGSMGARSTSSSLAGPGPGAALLCAVPLGAAVLGVAASAWGWMV